MAIVNVNSISGINSITAQSTALNFYDSAGGTLSIGADVTGGVTVATGATISGSTNTITASTNGGERLRITSSGNVGINSTSPAYLLDIASSSASMRLNSTATSTLVMTSGASNAARIEFGDLANNDTGYIYYDNSNDSMQFATNGSTERLRIDSSGRVCINTASTASEGIEAQLQVRQDSSGWNIEALRSINGTSPPRLWFGKSRGSSGSQTVVSDDDQLGEVRARGYDGTNYIESATVAFEVDGSVTTGNMPGRISFYTSPSGGSLSERLRIDSKGNFIFKNGALIENGFYDNGGGITGDYTHDLATYGNVHYAATDAAGAFTYNVRVDSSTTLNSVMSTGDACSITLISSNGNTARYMTAFKVDGTTQTVEWAGASAPSAATGSGWDIYSFTIVKTGDATFKVFASFTNHG